MNGDTNQISNAEITSLSCDSVGQSSHYGYYMCTFWSDIHYYFHKGSEY